MAAKKKPPHVLMVPHPAQGHIFPMLKLAQKLANEHGIAVTVANLEFIHRKIAEQSCGTGMIRLVSVPDGFESPGDADDWLKMAECLEKVVPVQLRKLLEKQKESAVGCDGDGHEQEISWVIADAFASAAFVVATEMGIKTAALWTASMDNLALLLRLPQLIEAGTIDENGFLLNNLESISLSYGIPAWKINELTWNSPGAPDDTQKFLFTRFYINVSRYSQLFGCLLVNSFHELETSACQMFPDTLPIGPLVSEPDSRRHNNNNNNVVPSGSFWQQDSTCVPWLDEQPPDSVLYVAFGSITVVSQQQFSEFALGLEMTGKPFLWVIRPDFVKGSTAEFPQGFWERVGGRGKVVGWANQEAVLSHPATACFVSHCGWNSTLDGLCAGVPFLCWPYFVDQFHNRDSICEAWKVGLNLKADDETGMVTSSEIASKVGRLLSDDTIRCNSLRLRGSARDSVTEGGSSSFNFASFVHRICSLT
ncbi:unnamed protein product [Linum trigynum]|uniref:UDP-glycosyltransferase 1 n=1 Tax=Linum trigynum TaxID=586398 RepID=A0AAV2GNS7_9ROSI